MAALKHEQQHYSCISVVIPTLPEGKFISSIEGALSHAGTGKLIYKV